MFRRQFVKMLAAVGTGAIASMATAEASTTVTWHVKGFTCITCAVGLDTLLQQEKGVASSKSSYPDGIVIIKFDPKQITEASLRSCIAEMGFTVEEKPAR